MARLEKTYLVLALLSLVWGSTWLAIKVGLGSMPPFYFAALRFVVASSVLLPIVLAREARQTGPGYATTFFTGLLLIPLPYALVYWGAQYIPSGMTAVLFSTMPIFVAVFSRWFLPGERVTAANCAGLLLAMSGILLIYSNDITAGGSFSSLGIASVLAGSVTSSLGVVLLKRRSSDYDPVRLTTVHFVIGAVFLSALGGLLEEWSEVEFTASSMAALLYLSVIGSSLAFVLYYWLLTKMEATRASLLVYVTPIVALYLGWAFLGEPVTARMAAGSAFVLGGIKLAS